MQSIILNFDEDKQIFSPCYKDCLNCSGKEDSSLNMNCLSCENDLIFYNKTKNCIWIAQNLLTTNKISA